MEETTKQVYFSLQWIIMVRQLWSTLYTVSTDYVRLAQLMNVDKSKT